MFIVYFPSDWINNSSTMFPPQEVVELKAWRGKKGKEKRLFFAINNAIINSFEKKKKSRNNTFVSNAAILKCKNAKWKIQCVKIDRISRFLFVHTILIMNSAFNYGVGKPKRCWKRCSKVQRIDTMNFNETNIC